jgi:hypothetical protein
MFRVGTPTEPLPAPAPQTAPPDGWWPHSVHDIVEAWALDEIAEWLQRCTTWHRRGGLAGARTSGPTPPPSAHRRHQRAGARARLGSARRAWQGQALRPHRRPSPGARASISASRRRSSPTAPQVGNSCCVGFHNVKSISHIARLPAAQASELIHRRCHMGVNKICAWAQARVSPRVPPVSF